MSERDNGRDLLEAVLVLAIMVLCIFISYNHTQVRDLQRRVGQLELR